MLVTTLIPFNAGKLITAMLLILFHKPDELFFLKFYDEMKFCQPEELSKAFDAILEKYKRIDIVVNSEF